MTNLDDLSDVIADDEIWRDAMMAFAKSWPWFVAMWRRESDGVNVTPEPFEAFARVVLEAACKAMCGTCNKCRTPDLIKSGYYHAEGGRYCLASPIRKLMEASE